MWWIFLFSAVGYLFYLKCVKPTWYWKERNVPYSHAFIFLGMMKDIIFRRKSFYDSCLEVYNKYPDKRYSGTFQFSQPVLVLRDPDLIKQLTVKDFDHFTDHIQIIDPDSDPIFGKNLFGLKGEQWRDMRSTLSPAFTSSKMKAMFPLMIECAEQFTKYFENENKEIIELDIKDSFRRYTNDVIAYVVFGIKCDSLTNKENEFLTMGKNVANFGVLRSLKFSIMNFLPTLSNILGLKFSPKETDFFERLVADNIKYREEQHIVRPDVMHLLLESKKGRLRYEEDNEKATETGFATVQEASIKEQKENQKKHKQPITNLDIAAQAMIFFFAGFDTSSTMLSFVAHELAENPEIQEKLQQKVDETLIENDGKVTYDSIIKLKYLDMVFSETLRKWPVVPSIDRLCVKEYTIPPLSTNEKPLKMEVGAALQVPILGLHYDPKYFSNPSVFDPERFNEENSKKIQPYTYLPFGVGPRNCIGSRFAIMEVKILIFYLLSKFNLDIIEKSTVPMKLGKSGFAIAPATGFWLGLRKRNLPNK